VYLHHYSHETPSGTVESAKRTFFAIHGWGGDHRTYAPIEPWREPEVDLYAPDLPGYGGTPPPESWTVDGLAASVASALDRVPSPRMTLVGNCSGAIIGLLGALQRPERIERIVLIDPFAYTPRYFRIFLWPVIGRAFYMFAFASPLGRWIANLATSRHRDASTDMTASFREINHDATWKTLKVLHEVGTIDRFAPLVVPTDIIVGARTFGAVRRSLAHWTALWPHARIHEIRGAGHLPIQEASEEVARRIFEPTIER